MNKQGKDGIEWCDYTLNPVVGCKRGCFYCYARQFSKLTRGAEVPFSEITYYPERLNQLITTCQKPARIFIGSMTDLFADWMPRENVDRILEVVKQCPRHTFLFLTKSPENYHHFVFPQNCWLGATYTGGKDIYKFNVNRENKNLYLSVEPLIEETHLLWLNGLIKWVILGAMSGHFAKWHKPRKEWIEEIIEECKRLNTPLFMKSNLKPYWNGELIQEYPQ